MNFKFLVLLCFTQSVLCTVMPGSKLHFDSMTPFEVFEYNLINSRYCTTIQDRLNSFDLPKFLEVMVNTDGYKLPFQDSPDFFECFAKSIITQYNHALNNLGADPNFDRYNRLVAKNKKEIENYKALSRKDKFLSPFATSMMENNIKYYENEQAKILDKIEKSKAAIPKFEAFLNKFRDEFMKNEKVAKMFIENELNKAS